MRCRTLTSLFLILVLVLLEGRTFGLPSKLIAERDGDTGDVVVVGERVKRQEEGEDDAEEEEEELLDLPEAAVPSDGVEDADKGEGDSENDVIDAPKEEETPADDTETEEEEEDVETPAPPDVAKSSDDEELSSEVVEDASVPEDDVPVDESSDQKVEEEAAEGETASPVEESEVPDAEPDSLTVDEIDDVPVETAGETDSVDTGDQQEVDAAFETDDVATEAPLETDATEAVTDDGNVETEAVPDSTDEDNSAVETPAEDDGPDETLQPDEEGDGQGVEEDEQKSEDEVLPDATEAEAEGPKTDLVEAPEDSTGGASQEMEILPETERVEEEEKEKEEVMEEILVEQEATVLGNMDDDDRPCRNSSFGCCPGSDNDIPAHGPNGEGCCLSSKHGCCSDNVRPNGPNGEGCDCQSSSYGCCPDEVTTAMGPNMEGCGCQHSPHGCCPDQYTQATASGCPCHTFEHGCCPDGTTVAKGPNLEGCAGCEASEHGCCPDSYTPAEGPYSLGCDCAGSKNGCCPDGVSEVLDANDNETGLDFAGCGETPGEACHLPKDTGSCKDNFTVRWFFDREYGGCSRFWWSDCGGNSNRFSTSESCERQCVSPGGSGRCYLPKVTGPCKGSYSKWYFDTQWKKCMPFKYGGCLGNDNRFDSQVECQEACLVETTVEDLDVCSQPMEPGPCRGEFPRFYYDGENGVCKGFNYTGCKGNRNRFSTAEACTNACQHKAKLATAKRVCVLPKVAATGASAVCEQSIRMAAWHFDDRKKRCLPFYFNGCDNGNDNRFSSLEECETACPNAFPPEVKIGIKILVVEENQEALLKIAVQANPPPTVVWQFKDQKIEFGGADARSAKLPDGSLQIRSALIDDSGVYTVIADNGLGHVARNQITLKVHPSKMPLEVAISKDKTEFDFGQALILPCSVKGYPIPIIRWYKNNTPLPKTERISVSDDNTMTITRATPIDGGIYTCRATNKHESVSDTVEVRVKKGEVPKECVDKPGFARCDLIVRAQFCTKNRYYSEFCCKSCTLAGQLTTISTRRKK